MVLRRRGIEHLYLFHLFDGYRFEQCCELIGGHRRGFAVENDRDAACAGERERAVLLAYAGQFGERLVGVGGDFTLCGDLQIVAQTPLLDLHQRAFAPNDYFVHDVRRLDKRDDAGIVVRSFDSQRFVAEMLKQQTIGTDVGCKNKTTFEVARYGIDIDRITGLHDDRNSGDGLLFAVYDASPYGLRHDRLSGECAQQQENEEAEMAHRLSFTFSNHLFGRNLPKQIYGKNFEKGKLRTKNRLYSGYGTVWYDDCLYRYSYSNYRFGFSEK